MNGIYFDITNFYTMLSILCSGVFGLPAWCVASVPELNVLAREILLNQDKECSSL